MKPHGDAKSGTQSNPVGDKHPAEKDPETPELFPLYDGLTPFRLSLIASCVANVGDFAARKSVNNAIALWNESGDRLGCQKNRVDPPPREQTTNRVSFAQLANAGYIASSRMDKPISSAKGIKKAVQNYVEDLQRRSMEQVPKNASPVRLQERLKDIKAAFKNGNFPFGEIRSFQAFQSIQRQKNQLRLKKHVK